MFGCISALTLSEVIQTVSCDVEVDQLKHLRVILVVFEVVPGLPVNWIKSYLYPVNEVTNCCILTAKLLPYQLLVLDCRWGLSTKLIASGRGDGEM